VTSAVGSGWRRIRRRPAEEPAQVDGA